jgi:hypothetical protein
MHLEQVLQQKIQSRKLEKMEESRQLMKEQAETSTYQVGSAKRYDITINVTAVIIALA